MRTGSVTRKIFLDLDGTLLDSTQRIHRLFCELAGSERLDYHAYWSLKREGNTQRAMLLEHWGIGGAEADRFKRQWLEKIEETDRLAQDRPYPKAESLLRELTKSGSLFIVTGRQDGAKALQQVGSYGWQGLVQGVLATGLLQGKAEAIQSAMAVAPDDVIIGDSGEDMLAGKALGIRTVAVTYGFTSREKLLGYRPDAVVDEIESIGGAI